jgi:multiple sugar transport system permease protein
MRLKHTVEEAAWAYLFILPALLGFVIFASFPILFGAWISLTDWDAFSRPLFTGLANYRRLITLQEPVSYATAIKNTLFFVLMMPVGVAIQLLLALLVDQKLRLSRLFRSVFFLPSITSAAAVAMVWYWIYDTNFGLVNWLLSLLHIPPVPWLESARWAKPALWIMMTWQGAGYGMMINLAALQGIPEELLETAMIDGAGPWRRFWSVTLPLLTPALFFQFVTGAIGAFQVFGQIWMTTRGGPASSTYSMVLFIYNYAFRHNAWGFASAAAYVLALMILVLTIAQFHVQRRWVFYGG